MLQGKSYKGREQDVWALGVLLYTIVYKENPFYNVSCHSSPLSRGLSRRSSRGAVKIGTVADRRVD